MSNKTVTYELSLLARRTRELRRQLGLSQGQFAEKIGSNTSYISRIETDATGYLIPADFVTKMELGFNDLIRTFNQEAEKKGLPQLPEIAPGYLSENAVWMGRQMIQELDQLQLSKFAIELKKQRELKQWNQLMLATQSGLSPSMISKLEVDSAGFPSSTTIDQLNQALGLNPNEHLLENYVAAMELDKYLATELPIVVGKMNFSGEKNSKKNDEILKVLKDAQDEIKRILKL